MTTDIKLPVEDTTELAETLTEFEVNNGVISADKQNEEGSATDRFKQRLDRFGKIAPEAKKISRALRFAIDGTAKKRRLERFGVIPHSTEDERQKKRQRTDRFGVVTPSTTLKKNKSASNTTVLTDTIKKRAERFGDISQVAKTNTLNEQKVKRAERFKLITSV